MMVAPQTFAFSCKRETIVLNTSPVSD